jgi:hypothetical protein
VADGADSARAGLPDLPRIYADFNRLITAYPHRVLLDTPRTLEDLRRNGLSLTEGLRAMFYDPDADERGERDGIATVGVVSDDAQYGLVAVLDGSRVTRESDWLAD